MQIQRSQLVGCIAAQGCKSINSKGHFVCKRKMQVDSNKAGSSHHLNKNIFDNRLSLMLELQMKNPSVCLSLYLAGSVYKVNIYPVTPSV